MGGYRRPLTPPRSARRAGPDRLAKSRPPGRVAPLREDAVRLAAWHREQATRQERIAGHWEEVERLARETGDPSQAERALQEASRWREAAARHRRAADRG